MCARARLLPFLFMIALLTATAFLVARGVPWKPAGIAFNAGLLGLLLVKAAAKEGRGKG